jgi:hypothetical protein
LLSALFGTNNPNKVCEHNRTLVFSLYLQAEPSVVTRMMSNVFRVGLTRDCRGTSVVPAALAARRAIVTGGPS